MEEKDIRKTTGVLLILIALCFLCGGGRTRSGCIEEAELAEEKYEAIKNI